MIANDSSPDVHEMREIFLGDQAPVPGGGLLEQLLRTGHAVSFIVDPEGFVAHVDVVSDGTLTPHTGIATTVQGALEAAAFGAGLTVDGGDYVPPTVADALAARLADLEGIVADQAEQLDDIDGRTSRSQALLIRALAKAIGVPDRT